MVPLGTIYEVSLTLLQNLIWISWVPSHSFLFYTTVFIQILETTKIIKPKVSNGKKTAYKSTTFAHPNLQTTSLVLKSVTYKSTTFGVWKLKNSINLLPTIYYSPLTEAPLIVIYYSVFVHSQHSNTILLILRCN